VSADNAIVILETKGPEYRVAHIMGPDGIRYDEVKNDYTSDPDVLIKNAREYWKGCKVFTDKEDAVKEAIRLHEEIGWTEYGILEETIERKF
jgi:G:T-mismatch repair DNA endonuclease (very short patch repair protein)